MSALPHARLTPSHGFSMSSRVRMPPIPTRVPMHRRDFAPARLRRRRFRRALRWCARQCGRRPTPMRATRSRVAPRGETADADARDAIEGLAKEVRAREIDLPDLYRDAWSAQRAIMAVEMAHNLGQCIDKGGETSRTFRELIEEGRRVTATQYLAALRDAERY